MKTQIQFNTFNFHSNSVRVIKDPNQEIWFCGTDVCDVLGYANSRKALQDHCKSSGVTKRYTPTKGGNQELTFINEPNLYRLIIKSRKPEAEPFEAWVFEEVLPQIRKTGKYSLQNSQQLALPEPEKKYTFEFTEYELEQLAWLWFGHKQMNTLLGKLYEPLNALGSRFSGTVYSHAHEYRLQYEDTQATLKRLVEPFKQSKRLNWQRVIPRISPQRKQLDF
ncbi:hypothetical protein L5B97_00255 [Avibacterium sp. 20-15]|uniref:BRO family protein n=1 Tax=unclassified Avibacterium TaxID=2685287 RepID=UPI002026591B|nr:MULTISPECIES: BRO family protein [unclassified Avibacterium]MCW9731933.1 hypothetical protein [Avibacterium sp. 20-15]URL04122.1 hypothetical protein L4F93_11335 [Avibacterium sp. 20-132]